MIYSEKFETKTAYECDVLVSGGGIAGIAAALAAARCGKKVIFTERGFMLGGLGTAGLVTIYLPLCDGMGRQVSFGIAEELLRLSVSMGGEGRYPANWLDENDPGKRTNKDPRFEAGYNAQMFALLSEKVLLSEGVKILYGTMAASAVKEGDRLRAVVCENKSGRFAIEAKGFVDATGDADVVHFAGVPEAIFGQGNVLASWYYRHDERGYVLRPVGFCDIPDKLKAEQDTDTHRGARRFGGLDCDEITEYVELGHANILKEIVDEREAGHPDAVPATIPTIPQFRMTRRLSGAYTLDDVEVGKYFEDSVGMVSDWRKRGPVYEVPFGTLYSPECVNLFVAGRCTSVTDAMWDIMRVIPCCSVTGQAAGTAAALCSEAPGLPDIGTLGKVLRENGVKLHLSEL